MKRLAMLLLTMVTLSGCGSDTSFYFCTGSLCAVDRDPVDDEDNPEEPQPVTVSALTVARTTPAQVQSGLDLDGLQSAITDAPDMIGGWLLAGSLGLLVDDSDNAATSRFLDGNRYWLTNPSQPPADNNLINAGLKLLAMVTAERDQGVAENAAALSADVMLEAATIAPDVAERAAALLQSRQVEVQAGSCCDAQTLAAASVVLCDQLTEGQRSDATFSACQTARQWVTHFLAGEG